ncbi:MAG: hypothetical protein IPI61_12505 [Syntrophaceae bacterium]|nr:hypothetical protein [Syntrophaceae bacterium]
MTTAETGYGVYEVVGHHGLHVLKAHLLLMARSMRIRRCGTGFRWLAHGADAAVAQVVDVVDAAVALAELRLMR